MTRYEEICEAYTETEPRRRAIDQIFRELPERMRQAIKEDIAAPDGEVPFLTAMYGRPVGYVYVACKSPDESGNMKWGPVNDGDLVRHDRDGMIYFGIGLVLIRSGLSLLPTTVHFKFIVEEVTEDAINLTIENAPGTISIDLREPNGYAAAAANVTDWLKGSLTNVATPIGNSSPIGFGR